MCHELIYVSRTHIPVTNSYNRGFYDEVVYKLEGTIFLMFQIFFEMLPLITVWQCVAVCFTVL